MKPAPTIALLASVTLALAVGSARSLHAQQATPSASALSDAGGDDQTPVKRPSPFAKGTILEMDPRSQSFALETPDGVRTFVWTVHTYVYRGKEKLSMEKLQVGDHIKLSFSTNEHGKAEVKRIKVDLINPETQTNQQTEVVK
jgi:Cu/Ag efflux protein CusF